MHVNHDALRRLVSHVGEFHVTDRKLKQAQERISALLEQDRADDAAAEAYAEAVRHYFAGFEREAREHLRSVDKRLEQINQVHFNLTAERSVAVTRIEKTQTVLSELSGLKKAGTA